jgi:hypothetical protein
MKGYGKFGVCLLLVSLTNNFVFFCFFVLSATMAGRAVYALFFRGIIVHKNKIDIRIVLLYYKQQSNNDKILKISPQKQKQTSTMTTTHCQQSRTYNATKLVDKGSAFFAAPFVD